LSVLTVLAAARGHIYYQHNTALFITAQQDVHLQMNYVTFRHLSAE